MKCLMRLRRWMSRSMIRIWSLMRGWFRFSRWPSRLARGMKVNFLRWP
jgi:hypothetical protein